MNESPATRHSLIVKLRDPADSAAWGEFVAIYEPLVYRLGRLKGLQDADAQDLCQEVFQAVAQVDRPLGRDPGRGSFRGWLSRITRNLLINFLTRRRHRFRGSGGTSVQELLEAQPADDPSATAVFEAEHRRRLFRGRPTRSRTNSPRRPGRPSGRPPSRAVAPAEVAAELGLVRRGGLHCPQPGPGPAETADQANLRRGSAIHQRGRTWKPSSTSVIPDRLRLLADDRFLPRNWDGSNNTSSMRGVPRGSGSAWPTTDRCLTAVAAIPGRRLDRSYTTAEAIPASETVPESLGLPHPVRLARLARPARRLRGQGRARPRRHGRRAQGVRPGAEPDRRDQGPVRARWPPAAPRVGGSSARRRAAAAVVHEHVVPIYAVGRDDGPAVPGHGIRPRPLAPGPARPARAAWRCRKSCGSACRRRPGWPRPMPRVWSTATSSRPTSCWRTASSGSSSPTSAWPGRSTTPA